MQHQKLEGLHVALSDVEGPATMGEREGFEPEPFCGRQRSGSTQAKS
jgi:hypothetical protein